MTISTTCYTVAKNVDKTKKVKDSIPQRRIRAGRGGANEEDLDFGFFSGFCIVRFIL